MCTADTIITIATRENMGVSSIFYVIFFFFFLSFFLGDPISFSFCSWSLYHLSMGFLFYLIGAVAVYYCIIIFFFLAYFGIKKGGSSYSFTSTLQRKSIHFPSIFLTQVFFICAQTVVGRPDGGKRE